MFREAVPVIDKRTTLICLEVAGQIVEAHAPFKTLAGEYMHPPFHVHCRTMEAPWLPGFQSLLKDMARQEKATRPYKQRLKAKARKIPGPDDVPTPVSGSAVPGQSGGLLDDAGNLAPQRSAMTGTDGICPV